MQRIVRYGTRASLSDKKRRFAFVTSGPFVSDFNYETNSAILRYSIWRSTASCAPATSSDCGSAMWLMGNTSPSERSLCSRRLKGQCNLRSPNRLDVHSVHGWRRCPCSHSPICSQVGSITRLIYRRDSTLELSINGFLTSGSMSPHMERTRCGERKRH